MIEVAWAAGLFEGEGCFSLTCRPSGYVAIIARLAMTDREIVERFGRVVGCGRFGLNRRPEKARKTMYEWTVEGADAERLYSLIGPFLGSRRRARFQEILAIRREYESRLPAIRSAAISKGNRTKARAR